MLAHIVNNIAFHASQTSKTYGITTPPTIAAQRNMINTYVLPIPTKTSLLVDVPMDTARAELNKFWALTLERCPRHKPAEEAFLTAANLHNLPAHAGREALWTGTAAPFLHARQAPSDAMGPRSHNSICDAALRHGQLPHGQSTVGTRTKR
jgi:hypothetical protein